MDEVGNEVDAITRSLVIYTTHLGNWKVGVELYWELGSNVGKRNASRNCLG